MIETISQLRSRIVDHLKFTIIFLGTILFATTSIRNVYEQNYIPFIIHTAILVIALFALLSRNVSNSAKALVLVSGAYIIGIVSFIQTGPQGSGPLWFFVACSLTATLFGRKQVFIALIVVIISVTVMLLLRDLMIESWVIRRAIDQGYVLERFIDLVFQLGLGIIPITFLVNNAEQALVETRKKSESLDELNNKLHDTNRALMTLNDTIANGLNKPIRRILFYSELMQEQANEDQDFTLLKKIDSNTRHISRIVTNAQQLSKIGDKSLEPVSFSLEATLTKISKRINRNYETPIRLEFENKTAIVADPSLLNSLFEFIFLSLVYYAGDQQQVVCTITTKQENETSQIMLRTNLSSLAKSEETDQYVALYSPFFDNESTITGSELIIAQQIASLHNGYIEVIENESDRLDIAVKLGAI